MQEQDTNNQLETKQDVAAKNNAVVSDTINQQSEKSQATQPQQPVYNPFYSGLRLRDIHNILAGGDPDHPLVEFDPFGGVKFHPENVGKTQPVEFFKDEQGRLTQIKSQEQAIRDAQDVQKSVDMIYSAIAPDYEKDYNRSSILSQILRTPENVAERAIHTMFGTGLNIVNAAKSVKRNVAESDWKAFVSGIDNSDGSLNDAENIYKMYEAAGYDFTHVNINSINANGKVRAILKEYQNLLETRKEDYVRAKIKALYEEDFEENGLEEEPVFGGALEQGLHKAGQILTKGVAGSTTLWTGNLSKETKADRRSGFNQFVNMVGDVAASAIMFGTFGRAVGTISNIALKFAGQNAAAALSTAYAVGNASVFVPSFMNQYESLRTQALLKGMDYDTAVQAGIWGGLAEGLIEAAGFSGFNRLYSKGNYLWNAAVRNIIPEMLEEGLQQISEDVITNRFGMSNKSFCDILQDTAYAMLGGAIGGAFAHFGNHTTLGIAAAVEKVHSNFHRAINQYNDATIKAGVAIAKQKIDSKRQQESTGVNTAEQTTNSSETKEQKNYMEEFAKKYGHLSNKEQAGSELTNSQQEQIQDTSIQEQGNVTQAESEVVQQDATAAEETNVNQAVTEQQAETQNQIQHQEQTQPAEGNQVVDEKGVEDVAQATEDMFEMLSAIAKDKMRKKKNMTPEQKDNLIKVIWDQTQRQATGKEISKVFDDNIAMALFALDAQNDLGKQRAKQVKEMFAGLDIDEKTLEKLASKDLIESANANWDVFESSIGNFAEMNGFSKEEGIALAKTLRSLFYDLSVIDSNFSVLQLYKYMQKNMANAQIAVLHGQTLPAIAGFGSVLVDIAKQNKRILPRSAKNKALETIEWLFSADQINIQKAKERIYGKGNEVNDDNNLTKTKRALQQQAILHGKILQHLAIDIGRQLTNKDILAITLMHLQGVSRSDINTAFGFKSTDSSISAEDDFNATAQEMFPRLTDEQLAKLEKLGQSEESGEVEGFRNEIYGNLDVRAGYQERESKKQIEQRNKKVNVQGFYIRNEKDFKSLEYETDENGNQIYKDVDKQMAVVSSPRTSNISNLGEEYNSIKSFQKTFFHEGLHLGIGYVIGRATSKTDEFGKTIFNDIYQPIPDILRFVRTHLQNVGIANPTEEMIEETLIDVATRFVARGQTGNEDLNALFAKLDKNIWLAKGSLVGSALNTTTRLKKDEVDKRGNQKELTKKDIKSLKESIYSELEAYINNSTPLTIISRASDLASSLDVKDILTSNGTFEEKLDLAHNYIKDFLSAGVSCPLSDTYFAANEGYYTQKDLSGLLNLAQLIADDSKKFAYQNMIDGSSEEYLQGVRDDSNPVFFMKTLDAKQRKSYKATFREQQPLGKEVVKTAKEKLTIGNVWKHVKDSAAYFLQSIDRAAPDSYSRALLNREFFEYGMRVREVNEQIGIVTSEIDKKMQEVKQRSLKDYESLQRSMQTYFWAPLASCKEDGYKRGIATLTNKISPECGQAFENLCVKLKEIGGDNGLLARAGVAIKMVTEGDYFPALVKDYYKLIQHLGYSIPYNEFEKIRSRIFKPLIEKYGKYDNIPDKEKLKAEVDVTNAIGGIAQRNVSDTDAVTAFHSRQIVDYTKDPSILNCYADPFDTLSKYFEAMYRTIMMRNLVGKVTYDADGNAIMDFTGTGKLSQYLKNLPTNGLDPDVVNNFKDKLAMLSKRSSKSNALFDTIRKFNQMTTLGSFVNAVNQMQDLSFIMQMFGVRNTFEGLKIALKDQGIKLEDIGVLPSNELFRMVDEDTLSKLGRKIFKITGFEKVDKLVKQTSLNAATKFMQQALNSDTNSREYKEAMWYIDQCYGAGEFALDVADPIGTQQFIDQHNAVKEQVIDDLKNGKDTFDTRYVKWFLLTKTQPINALTIPALYNALGAGGKLMYQFATVPIRQLEFIKERIEMRMQTATGNPKVEAAKEMIKLALFLAMIGLPKSFLENTLKGRKTDILKETMLSPFHVLMINEYTLNLLKKEGLFSAMVDVASPGFQLGDALTRDLYRLVTFRTPKGYFVRSVPVLGPSIWGYMLGGKEQSMRTDQFIFSSKQYRNNKKQIEKNNRFLATGQR